MSPDIHDLGDLLEQLRTRHAVVYYCAVALMALGILGLVCLFDAIFPSPKSSPEGQYLCTIRPERGLWYSRWRIKSDGDFSRPATERKPRCQPSKEGIRPVGGKTHLSLSPKTFEGIFLQPGGMMSSHNDSFVASGSSPTLRKKLANQADFKVDDQGSIFLLHPLNETAREWVNGHIGQDNGFQPYYPTVVVEHRYIADIVAGIQGDGLAVR